MKTSEKLETNWKAGLWTEIRNGLGKYRLITMKTEDGRFHSTYPQELDELNRKVENNFWIDHYTPNLFDPEYIDSRDWQIIRTIHPSELMGPGYEAGQKVRIKPNAKEECEKWDIFWSADHELMLKDSVGTYSGAKDAALKLFYKDDDTWACFPPTALEPYFEDEAETIEIGGKKYSKAEFEKAVKNLKPLE